MALVIDVQALALAGDPVVDVLVGAAVELPHAVAANVPNRATDAMLACRRCRFFMVSPWL
jgi:hypothetical protein